MSIMGEKCQNYKIIAQKDIAQAQYLLKQMQAWKEYLASLNAYFQPKHQLSKKTIAQKYCTYQKIYPVFQADMQAASQELQELFNQFIEAKKVLLPNEATQHKKS